MLLNPANYDHPVESVELRDTHISWVFLTGDFAYKVKKEIKFGDILDFSTLPRRKEFCYKEIELNSRFSSDIYIGVVNIDSTGKINGDRNIIEYGVKMKQMPENRLMSQLLAKNMVSLQAIKNIASEVATFHRNTDKVPERGERKYIGEKWDENFRTTSQFRKVDQDFRDKIFGFMDGNKGLFKERINENRITDNHGDLQSQNIFIMPDDVIKIFDCIEFNPLLRYGDVAEDVGFLAMDLDFWGKSDYSDIFLKEYIRQSGDELLEDIIHFFKSYRAYVRGKVYGFQAENETNDQKKQSLRILSGKYYDLAHSYSEFF